MKSKLLSDVLDFLQRYAFLMGLLLGALVLFTFVYEGKVKLAPGIRVPDKPVQFLAKELDSAPSPWVHKGFKFVPLASYTLEAKVLGKERYRSGKEADISPYDLALGWAELSDQAIVDTIKFSQGGRWYYYKYDGYSIAQKIIQENSSNHHIIPANDQVLDVLHDIRRGDIVAFDGYLVEVSDENDKGWKWRSSLTRDDSGAHACEIFWVEAAKITTPKE